MIFYIMLSIKFTSNFQKLNYNLCSLWYVISLNISSSYQEFTVISISRCSCNYVYTEYVCTYGSSKYILYVERDGEKFQSWSLRYLFVKPLHDKIGTSLDKDANEWKVCPGNTWWKGKDERNVPFVGKNLWNTLWTRENIKHVPYARKSHRL